MNRYKVLVSAYACEPHRGSEPSVGWNWAVQASRFAHVTVITRENNRQTIEREISKNPNPHLQFKYYDLPNWVSFWKKGARGLHLYYTLWQRGLATYALNLHKELCFDIAHHLTFGNAFIAPGICRLPIPFVWGPIGMDLPLPFDLLRELGRSTIADQLLRQAAYSLSRFSPRIVQAQKRARRIIMTFQIGSKAVRPRFHSKIEIMTQVHVNEAIVADVPRKCRSDSAFRILSSGRHVPKKGFPLAIKAFAGFKALYPSSSMTITGDGPMRGELNRLTEHLGLRSSIDFCGQLPKHSQVMELMSQHDVFLFTSCEAGGMVVIEAMANGLPVVCLDFGGPGEYVTQECGIKVPLTEPEEVVQGLADALSRLASDKALYERLSAGAIETVRKNYLWDRVGDRLNALYQEVYQETKDAVK